MRVICLVRYGTPKEAFEVREMPDPVAGYGQVRIAVEVFGLNYADISARQGTYRDAPPIPCVIGYEVVGRVDQLGEGVSGPAAGTRVAALTRFGAYATSVVTDARALIPIPEDMDPAVAVALVTQGVTAYYCAEEMVRLYSGDHVLVHAAAGGVGTLLVQICKHRDCVVYGTAGSDKKLDYLRELGVDHPINYQMEDFVEAVRRIRGRDGLDVIFDSIGGAYTRKGFRLLAPGGRMVGYGAASHEAGSFQILRSLRFALSFGFFHPIPLLMDCKAMIGVNMLRLADQRPLTLRRCLDGVERLWREGVLRPTVGGRFTADQIADAHELLGSRGSIGKIAVTW